MKIIDHYVGIPICLFSDLLNKIFFFYPTRKYSAPRKILVIKLFGMGSIMLASPMLRALKQKYPDATIAFLTFSGNRDIIERLGQVDRIYTLRTERLVDFSADVLRHLYAIRREKFDVTIDMEFFAKFSTIMTFFSGSPMRIGYFLRQIWRGDLLTHQIYYNHFKHVTEIFAALAAPLDVTVEDYTLQRPAVTPQEDKAAADILAQHRIGDGELVIIFNVNASELSFERRWPKENFQTLARALLKDLRAKCIFIGGGSDAPYVYEVIAGLPHDGRIVNLSGRTGLGELIGIIGHCGLFISNDSGPLHLAEALGVPTVSFFGPEIPTLYGPQNEKARVFYAAAYCSPCLNVYNAKTAPCAGNNICMQRITPDSVLATIRSHFNSLWEKYGDV